MRKTFPFVFIFALLLTSCEKEETLATETSTDFTHQINSSSTNRNQGTNDRLEIHLRWTTYAISTVLINDFEVQSQLSALINPTTKTVKLIELFGGNGSPLNIEESFKSALYSGLGHPDHSGAIPDPKPPGGGHSTLETHVDLFYNYITNENCIELYFPNGLSFFQGLLSITSTGHPLNNSISNTGIRLLQQVPDPLSNPPIDPLTSYKVEVTDNYVSQHENIIVSRPYRGSTRYCLYNQYSDIDFLDFLD